MYQKQRRIWTYVEREGEREGSGGNTFTYAKNNNYILNENIQTNEDLRSYTSPSFLPCCTLGHNKNYLLEIIFIVPFVIWMFIFMNFRFIFKKKYFSFF